MEAFEGDHLLGRGLFPGSRGNRTGRSASSETARGWAAKAAPWVGVAAMVVIAAAAGIWYDAEAHPDLIPDGNRTRCFLPPKGRHVGMARWFLVTSLAALGGAIFLIAHREGRKKGRVRRLELAIHMRPLSPVDTEVFFDGSVEYGSV